MMRVSVCVLLFVSAVAVNQNGVDTDPFFGAKLAQVGAGALTPDDELVDKIAKQGSDIVTSAGSESGSKSESESNAPKAQSELTIDPYEIKLLQDSAGLDDGDEDDFTGLNALELDRAAGGLSSSRRRRRKPSESPSPSETPSASMVASESMTPSESASPTASPTISISPSVSLSSLPSESATRSRNPSPSPEPSVSASASRSPAPSESSSVSLSASASVTVTPSASASVSFSESISLSPSTSVSHWPTESNSISLSPSASVTSEPSSSPTISFSNSLSNSISLTPSSSLSPTASVSAEASPSPTPSPYPIPPLPTRAVIAAVPSVEPFQPHPLERALYAEESRAEWSYDETAKDGPELWSKADKSFSACGESTTATQSPLDLFTFRIASPMSPLLTPQYAAGRMLVRNTGQYLRLVPHKGSLLYWGDKIFELVYVQIHTPSEHHMSGEAFPAELQFVHKAQDDDQMAVLALLFKQGLENPFLERVLEVAPKNKGEEEFLGGAINLGDAVPKDITQYKSGTRVSYPHYSYDGSLSTPPCRENVKVFVWSKPDHISRDQAERLQRLVSHPSSRPIQALNSRVVEYKSLF